MASTFTWRRARALRFAQRGLSALAMLVLNLAGVWGQGIPEPDLVLYGRVNNTVGGLLRVGSLQLAITQTGEFTPRYQGTVALRSLNDQFSYVIQVQCETAVPGLPVSADALLLGAAYEIGQVQVDSLPAPFVNPAHASFSLGATDRGMLMQVDFNSQVDPPATFEAWIAQFFASGSPSAAAAADPDGDGLTNSEEWVAGTLPDNANSVFAFIYIEADPIDGTTVRWKSVPGKTYTIRRSSELLQGFTDRMTGIASQGNETTYTDRTAAGGARYFYQLVVE